MESIIYDDGYRGSRRVFWHLSWYHVTAGCLFFIMIYPELKYLPLLAVIEDITFFLFSRTKRLTEGSWVNHGLKGFEICGQWVPWSYVLGILIYLIVELYIC
jgi:hypothetical protein